MKLTPSFRFLTIFVLIFSASTLYAEVSVDVEIDGVRTKHQTNIRLFLSIEQQKDHTLLSEGRLRRLHNKAKAEIEAAMQPFGYYKPTIQSSLVEIEEGQWLATYDIKRGPGIPIQVFDLSLSPSMQADIEFQKLIDESKLVIGERFEHSDYENFKSSLARLAAERGYFTASFSEHRVEIDLDNYVARVFLKYDGGSRYIFGVLDLQQDVLEPELLSRFIPFEKGDPYSLSALLDFQQALNDTDYFHSVDISPGKIEEGSNEVPVKVRLSPRKPNRYNFGLGYGTDTGARAKFGWQKPRVNRKGHRFDSEIGVSELGYSFKANYRVPILNPRTDQLVYSVGEVKEEFDDSESTLRTLGISLARSRGDWRETISLNYQREQFTIADDTDNSTLLIPGISWGRTWGNDFINVIDGLRFDISLRGADTGFASDTDFTQVRGTIKFITPLSPTDRFITRGTFGTTGTDEFDELPASIRFYAGGAQSVRGYSYQSLGPMDSDGEVVGGKHLATGSIEYEHSFNEKWGIAVFYDAGNAIDDLNDDLEHGTGFGIRWKSPIGPVRIDLASAITKDGEPWRLHINIGPDL